MEFETPEWLSKEFLQNVLESAKQYKLVIEDFEVDMPIAKGNNYACDIYGVKVKYRKSSDFDKLFNKSLIIKSPKQGPMLDLMVKFGFLDKEPRLYNEFSPKLKSIFGTERQQDDDDDDEYILPESYLSSKKYVIILDDLKTKDYQMVDRMKRLDYDHCVLAFKALAKFHAGSVIIHEKEPKFIEDIGQELFYIERPDELGKDLMPTIFQSFREEMKNYPELEKYSSWFEKNENNYSKILIEMFKPKDDEFHVLNHGDFWATNMLFKYNDDNIPIKVKLIDLQISRYTSPVVDIMYFMDSSVQEDVRVDRFDDLINIYLNELNSTLERYGSSKRLDKPDFDKSWSDRSFYHISNILCILPICISNLKPTEMMNIEDMKVEDFSSVDKNPFKAYYKNENYMKIAIKRLEELEKIGLITPK